MGKFDTNSFVSSLAHHAADPFRLLVESVVDYALYMVDPAGLVATWNPGAERIYGYRTEDIIGRHFSSFYRPEDIKAGKPERARALALEHGHYEKERLRVRADGSQFWAVVTVSNLKDYFGKHAGFSVITRDITERKRAEQAVTEEANRRRLLFENAKDAIVVLDRALRVLEANHSFVQMLGLHGRDVVGLQPWDWDVVYSTPEKVREMWPSWPTTPQSFSSVLRHTSGRLVDVEVSCNPAEYSGQQHLLCMFRDVTDRKRAEEAVRRERDLSNAILDSLPGVYYMYDEQRRFLRWNRRFEVVSEYAPEEIARLHPLDFFEGEDKRTLADKIENVFRDGVSEAEALLVSKSGRRTPYYFNGVRAEIDGKPCLLGMGIDISDHKRAEEELRATDQRMRQAAAAANVGLWDWTLGTNSVFFSPEWKRQIGYEEHEISSDFEEWRSRVHPEDLAAAMEGMQAYIADHSVKYTAEFRLRHRNGSYRWILSQGSLLFDEHGKPLRMLGSHVDVTEKRKLEQQLQQSQKMEAIGLLAGGVAHDFNNLLTVINGYSDLLLSRLPRNDPTQEILTEIHRAGQRAGTLTRQLLTFSRQQVMELKVLNVNSVVNDTEKMLRRLIGEDVILTTNLNPSLGFVKADVGQIEQILINLAVNARDAMPKGGNLTFETQTVELDETYCRAFNDLKPGEYVLLAVNDTGTGMDEATKTRIFEPFFTTKGVGKGTGLGLATVHGVVKQSRGHVAVYSELGRGTSFKIYLPKVNELPAPTPPPKRAQPMASGSETVLLVEDEEGVRILGRHILRSCGYNVLEAVNGKEALEIANKHVGPIHLLVSDVVMPYLGGRELAERIVATRPDCKVLFLSGYTDDAVIRHGVLEAEFAFLQKPFTPSNLSQKVRSVLENTRESKT